MMSSASEAAASPFFYFPENVNVSEGESAERYAESASIPPVSLMGNTTGNNSVGDSKRKRKTGGKATFPRAKVLHGWTPPSSGLI